MTEEQRRLLTVSSFQGPLPPPEMLAQYNKIQPDAANRLLTLVEVQSHHRMTTETIMIQTEAKLKIRGQLFSFCLGFVALIGAFALLSTGKTLTGMSTFLTALGIFVGVYFYDKRQEASHNKTDSKP